MTPEQQFYLQFIAAIFAGITPIVLGVFGLWIKTRLNRQDEDRAAKNEDLKAHIDNAKTVVVAVESKDETQP